MMHQPTFQIFTHPRVTTIAPNSSNTRSSHNKQTNKQCNNIAQEAQCKCVQATLHSASCTAKIALQPLHISVPSTKWVDYTECWFQRLAHINKSCHQKGQKQQMERQVSTIHINKFVDLPDGSTVQIVASGPLLTFLVIQKQQNGSRVLYVQCGENCWHCY